MGGVGERVREIGAGGWIEKRETKGELEEGHAPGGVRWSRAQDGGRLDYSGWFVADRSSRVALGWIDGRERERW